MAASVRSVSSSTVSGGSGGGVGVLVRSGSSVSRADTWYCHCCGKKNEGTVTKCVICGRPDSYAVSGSIHLPFHGDHCTLYRSNQVINVLHDIHEVDSNEQWTALHSACAHGHVSLVKQLLDYQSSINATTARGHTPLHLSVYSGSVECVAELLRRADPVVNVNAVTFAERETALHMAATAGHARICQLLLTAGAHVHAENVLSRTPLHSSALSGRVDIALLLLRSGARLNAVDAHGWTACQLAELLQHSELHELLIREGLKDKQAVLRDLPAAPWHSSLWDHILRTRSERTDAYEKEQRLSWSVKPTQSTVATVRPSFSSAMGVKEEAQKRRERRVQCTAANVVTLEKG